MRKREFLFVLLLALLPFVGKAQQKNYNGQHVSIKLTTGDSIQYDVSESAAFKPVVKNGKVEWSFLKWEEKEGSQNHEIELKDNWTLSNAESIDFRNFEYDEIETKKALIDFYHAMDGDNWFHHENWCSDKPICEWYGINGCNENQIGENVPWVNSLWIGSNNLSGNLPDCLERIGPLKSLGLFANNIVGEIPACLGNIFTLSILNFSENQLSGSIPSKIGELPRLSTFSIEKNRFAGFLPEEFILNCMNHKKMPGNSFQMYLNNYSGKIPKSIQEHPRFKEFWPFIILQNNPIDISDLVIPAPVFTTKDLNGNIIDIAQEYKKNKYTLLYVWGAWCSPSLKFNQKLISAYNAYKNQGFEIIGLHYDQNGENELEEFLKTHDLPWTNVAKKDWGWKPNGEMNDDVAIFNIRYSPQVFLVDQNSNIVFNGWLDKRGYNMLGLGYHCELLNYLEDKLGPIEYELYTSTDYSHDGEVSTLQIATKGQGVDLVFVGEGFTDKDISEGFFDQRMSEALEQFFAYEPYKSLRNRFNVYAVKAVSPNAEFYGSNAKHAIDEDPAKALEYASKVTNLIPNRPMHVNVVYNNASLGRSYCVMMEDDSYICYAMEGANNVLNHEAGGHGIGKLFDEYVEQGNEGLTLSEENKAEMENKWTALGWGANVDWHSNPTEVKWAKFINDERYANEHIGVYEGSYLYEFGAYRPTENSMMRYNNTPFNAPSREAIYKRVMKESEGEDWTYDWETFVAFDAAGHSQFVNALSSSAKVRKAPSQNDQTNEVSMEQRTAPPVFLKGSWRDYLKANKK